MYPQFAESTTTSAINEAKKFLSHKNLNISILEEYYDQDFYIIPIAKQLNLVPKDHHIVFSFHGLPYAHLEKIDQPVSTNCKAGLPCPKILPNSKHKKCYRAQCYTSAQLIAEKADIASSQYSVAFQSQLGKAAWTAPGLLPTLDKLKEQGISKLTILSPAFTMDCLETLEELDMQVAQYWRNLGGTEFNRLSCLNDDDSWASGLAQNI